LATIYTVTIPTKPYIRNFIATLYGDPIPITNKNNVGIFLIGVMTKTRIAARLNPGVKGKYFQQLTSEITCVCPLSQMANYGYLVNENHIIQINRYFESIFEEHLYFWVLNRIDRNKRRSGYQEAIETFMDRYILHETTNFDTLKKIEYRYREELKKNLEKSLALLSPQKSLVKTLF
jgi:hypothetical protein